MNAAPVSVRESLVRQAVSCRAIGSPLYATLLDGLLADHDRHGITARLLDGVSEQPHHIALPLRYLACAHRLALAGRGAQLAAHFASCGGRWDGTAGVVDDFLALARSHVDEFQAGVRRNVQTNEVGRAAVLASGFATIARRHRLPIDQLEIGASAGLLSVWDHFWFDTGASQMGEPQSPLRFGPPWWSAAPPDLGAPVTVIRRRASDVSPIDISTPDGRLTSMSFVWPDQTVRFDRLEAAIGVAATTPVNVERSDAGDWLAAQLGDAPVDGRATVIFHSIVWQYLPPASREKVRSAIAAAGMRATADSPVLWMRMEPATPDHADLRLSTWTGTARGAHDEVLAHVGYHGADIEWLAES